MKKNGLLLLSLSVFLLFACNQEQDLTEMLVESNLAAASCEVPGTILENECGMIIQVKNGEQFYANSFPKGFTPEVGLEVEMSYRRIVIQDNRSGACGGGNCCGDNQKNCNPTSSCMDEAGVSQIAIQCITPSSDS